MAKLCVRAHGHVTVLIQHLMYVARKLFSRATWYLSGSVPLFRYDVTTVLFE